MNKFIIKSYSSLKGQLWDVTEELRRKILLDNVILRDIGKKNISSPKGKCLFSYISVFVEYVNQDPEVRANGWDPQSLPAKLEYLATNFSHHTMYWESAEVVRQLVDKGFVVDCIDSRDAHLIKDACEYDLIIDEWGNFPKWAGSSPNSKKLFYCTSSDWIYQNIAELERLEWLFVRRGVYVLPNRQIPPILNPAFADLISIFGNRAGRATFGSFSAKTRKLWISSVESPAALDRKNWQVARNRFLFFAGGGWVHKGLDLVIEAFLKEPKLQLVICEGGGDFLSVYGKEIAEAGNITYLGFMDILGEQFREVISSTCAVIHPSASEGCSGAVVLCLQHGLIPLVTEITGLEVHDTWPALSGSTDSELIDNIRQRCAEIAGMSEEELDSLRNYFRTYAHKNHSRGAYGNSLSAVLDELITFRDRP